MIRSSLALAALAFTLAPLVACTSGDVAVGKTDQQLLSRKDGKATGDGKTCSWEATAAYDTAVSNASSSPSSGTADPNTPVSDDKDPAEKTTSAPANGPTTPITTGPYGIGDDFPSLDGCNECTCTAKGIMCTVRACAPGGGNGPTDPGTGVCPGDAKQCPDGTYVGRSGPGCDFVCPGDEPIACPEDAMTCPDGTTVGRSGPSCTFVCPGAPGACPQDALVCPNGKTVGRTGPKCEFKCD